MTGAPTTAADVTMSSAASAPPTRRRRRRTRPTRSSMMTCTSTLRPLPMTMVPLRRRLRQTMSGVIRWRHRRFASLRITSACGRVPSVIRRDGCTPSYRHRGFIRAMPLNSGASLSLTTTTSPRLAMFASDPQLIWRLQQRTTHVRNLCVLAHVDHGKTSFSDHLLSTNAVISHKSAGKVRFLDSRADEQERKITMKSSSIALVFQDKREPEHAAEVSATHTPPTTTTPPLYLINLIDSPGHVDFSSEVSTAVRCSDGAFVLVDVVEGMCVQTQAVLACAWREGVKVCLVLNKMDRLIHELKLTPSEAYTHVNKVIEQVNAYTSTFITADAMQEAAERDDGEVEIDDDKQVVFAPEKGNVIFASAWDCWALSVPQFARFIAHKLGMNVKGLRQALWGEYYYSVKDKKVSRKPSKSASKPMFVQFVLEPLWQVYAAIERSDGGDAASEAELQALVGKLPLLEPVPARELSKTMDRRRKVQSIFSRWLPLASTALAMAVDHLPDPIRAQENRMQRLWHPHPWVGAAGANANASATANENASDSTSSNMTPLRHHSLLRTYRDSILQRRRERESALDVALRSCDKSHEHVVLYVGKMIDMGDIIEQKKDALRTAAAAAASAITNAAATAAATTSTTHSTSAHTSTASSGLAPRPVYQRTAYVRGKMKQQDGAPAAAAESSYPSSTSPPPATPEPSAPADAQANGDAAAAAAVSDASEDTANKEDDDTASHAAEATPPLDRPLDRFIGFARVYAGTLDVRKSQRLHVFGPKYNLAQHITRIAKECVSRHRAAIAAATAATTPIDEAALFDATLTAVLAEPPAAPHYSVVRSNELSLYLLMATDLQPIACVPAGNVFGIGGLSSHILKTGSVMAVVPVTPFASMHFQSAPIVHVAIEPENAHDLKALSAGLQLLNQADPNIDVRVADTGELTIVASGELHLERCLRDLNDRFAKGIRMRVSEPIVRFRETIVEEENKGEDFKAKREAKRAAAANTSASSSSSSSSSAHDASSTADSGSADTTTSTTTTTSTNDGQGVAVLSSAAQAALAANSTFVGRLGRSGVKSLRFVAEDHTPNKQCTVRLLAVPLPSTFIALVEHNESHVRWLLARQTECRNMVTRALHTRRVGAQSESARGADADADTNAVNADADGDVADDLEDDGEGAAAAAGANGGDDGANETTDDADNDVDADADAAQQAAAEHAATPAAFVQQLHEALRRHPELTPDDVDRVFTLGPRKVGSCLLINRIRELDVVPSITAGVESAGASAGAIAGATAATTAALRKKWTSEDVVGAWSTPFVRAFHAVEHALLSGFHMATWSGPMCEEPMAAVAFLLLSVSFEQVPSEEVAGDADSNGSSATSSSSSSSSTTTASSTPSSSSLSSLTSSLLSGQLISTMLQACRHAFRLRSPRLVEAFYRVELQCSTDQLGALYAVLHRRRGTILHEDLREGTSIFFVTATLPVAESFAFAQEIRTRTGGEASPQLVFSHWATLAQDPYYVPRTEEEIEWSGESGNSASEGRNVAREYVERVRKRKGLAVVGEKVVVHAEKQRTLARKK